MNISKLFVAVGLTCMSLFAVSCSNEADEPVDSDVDMSLARKLTSGEIDRMYSLSKLSLYHNDSRTDGEWKKIDLSDYVGWQASLEDEIIVADGSVYVPFSMFSCAYGPHPLARPWSAYCQVTGCNKGLYISSELLIDEAAGKMKLGDHWCDIVSLSDSHLKVNYESTYLYGDGEEGKSRESYTYKVADGHPDTDKMLCYQNEYELTVDLLAKFRATFGESIDLNKYTNGMIIYDNPIVNFDDLERELIGGR